MLFDLPDHIVLKAKDAGFSTVEEYVRWLVENYARVLDYEMSGKRLSDEEWHRKFNKLRTMAKPRNPNMDDSRESMYADD